MKYSIILVTALSTLLYGQERNPFDSITFDKVIAYEFQGVGGKPIEHCLLHEQHKISKSIELSEYQLNNFLVVLCSNSSYGNTTAACFDPHFGMVYYKNEKIVASINICLDCNYLTSSIEIPATKNQMIKVDEAYSYPARGFSKSARESIHRFCTDIGFTKYLKPLKSIFDE